MGGRKAIQFGCRHEESAAPFGSLTIGDDLEVLLFLEQVLNGLQLGIMLFLLAAARARGIAARRVDLRNSGDTAGPRGQVVGYGACIVG